MLKYDAVEMLVYSTARKALRHLNNTFILLQDIPLKEERIKLCKPCNLTWVYFHESFFTKSSCETFNKPKVYNNTFEGTHTVLNLDQF